MGENEIPGKKKLNGRLSVTASVQRSSCFDRQKAGSRWSCRSRAHPTLPSPPTLGVVGESPVHLEEHHPSSQSQPSQAGKPARQGQPHKRRIPPPPTVVTVVVNDDADNAKVGELIGLLNQAAARHW